MGVALPVIAEPHCGSQIQWQISCGKEEMLNTETIIEKMFITFHLKEVTTQESGLMTAQQ